MTSTETVFPNQVAMKWKRYVVTLIVCALIIWAAFNPLANSVSPGWVALVVSIPVIWAIHGLVFVIARQAMPIRLKPYFTTAIGCALVMLFTIPPHLGFMLILFAIPLAIWILYSIGLVLIEPAQLRPRAIILGLWVAAILIALSAHWYYAVDARRDGDEYARVIERYKAVHGTYPSDMKAAGLAPKRNSYMHGYIMYEGKPSLVYAATFAMFDTYGYDFEHHVWVYQPD